MNERIQELYNQAARYAFNQRVIDQSFAKDLHSAINEKFAELIVAECTEQVRGQYVPVLEDKEMMKDTHWDGYVQCGVDSVVAIREHFFGVEE